jgi:hypothetical protein
MSCFRISYLRDYHDCEGVGHIRDEYVLADSIDMALRWGTSQHHPDDNDENRVHVEAVGAVKEVTQTMVDQSENDLLQQWQKEKDERRRNVIVAAEQKLQAAQDELEELRQAL